MRILRDMLPWFKVGASQEIQVEYSSKYKYIIGIRGQLSEIMMKQMHGVVTAFQYSKLSPPFNIFLLKSLGWSYGFVKH